MRIIRLTAENDNIFDCDFADEIIIKPNAQIALLNTSLDIERKTIVIGPGSNLIQYVLNGTEAFRSVYLDSETYGSTNEEKLLDDMTLKLNNSLGALIYNESYSPEGKIGYSQKEIGLQWKVSKEKVGTTTITNKILLEYKLVQYYARIAEFTKTTSITTTALSTINIDTIRRTTGENDQDAYLYGTVPFCEGGAQFTCQISSFAGFGSDFDETEGGFCIGLTYKDFSKGSAVPTIADIMYGAQVFQQTSLDTDPMACEIFNGTADTATARASEAQYKITYTGVGGPDNSYVGVIIALGKVMIVMYRDDPDDAGTVEEVIMGEYDLTRPSGVGRDTRELYPVIFCLSPGAIGTGTGDSATGMVRVKSIKYTANPYKVVLKSTLPLTEVAEAVEVSAVAPPVQRIAQEENRFILNTSLSDFLGYDNVFLPGPNSDDFVKNSTEAVPQTGGGAIRTGALAYQADKTFSNGTLNDNYVLEALSLSVDSYDGQTTERKSIIATIPATEGTTGALIYEPNNINKVSIRNATEVGIRNMKVRILTSDLQPVPVDGWSVITLGLYDTTQEKTS